MIKSVLLIAILMAQSASLWACKNLLDATKYRKYHVPEDLEPRDLKAEVPTLRKDAARYLADYEQNHDWNAYSDYGVTLTFLGRYKEAEKVYQALVNASIDRYVYHSNLGTLYELMGRNDEAYHYINSAYQTYQNGHAGSEWIHVNILCVKITPGMPASSQNLIDTDFGTDTPPRTTLTQKRLAKLSRHIRAQLHERMTFVQPQDSFVARLVFDLANVQVLLGQFEFARKNYEWARKYGMTGELLEARLAYIPEAKKIALKAKVDAALAAEKAEKLRQEQELKQQQEQKQEQENKSWQQVGAIGFAIVAVVGIYFVIQRLRRKKQ
jgi:tetratricopeptide (TPR) repeat protein